MKTTRAVITAAGRDQRTLALQTLVDRDGVAKSVLQVLIEEASRAGIEDICVVVCPGDEAAYKEAAGSYAGRLQFTVQDKPAGYGHAIYCAREFVGNAPFLHMIGDHVYVSSLTQGCAQQVVETAKLHDCSVSGVQATRENLLPYFGVIGGQRIRGSEQLYEIERVTEKPTPTLAEQTLLVPGLRAGHYLGLFGIHLLSPTVMTLLTAAVESAEPGTSVQLSPVLNALASHERYIALEVSGKRYPLDTRYGLLRAQLALGLDGEDREEVLAMLCELLAQRDSGKVGR